MPPNLQLSDNLIDLMKDGPRRLDCLAEVGGLELRNVVAKYLAQISGDPAEFRAATWEAQLGPSARISAGCLRWQELPRFSADAEMIRRWPIQQ